MEISDSKFDKMSDYAEKMLRYGGKLMQCFEDAQGDDMGDRDRDRDRDRDDDDWDDDDDMGNRGNGSRGGNGGSMGNRRGVKGTGRYSRVRYR